MKTLLLDTVAWDLVLDANGNIAVADEPYSIAQDVASAVRTFIGECVYNTSLGIPYFDQVLGQWPPVSLIQSLIEQEALKVPGVTDARCIITDFSNRVVNGQVQVKIPSLSSIPATAQTLPAGMSYVVNSSGVNIVTADGYYVITF